MGVRRFTSGPPRARLGPLWVSLAALAAGLLLAPLAGLSGCGGASGDSGRHAARSSSSPAAASP